MSKVGCKSFTNSEQEPLRLDVFLLNNLASDPEYEYLTRSQLKNLIGEGCVRVNDKVIRKAGSFLKPGEAVVIDLPENASSQILPYDYPLDIVYEDELLLVINKSSGLTVHPGAGNKDKTLLNALVNYLGEQSTPFIVHRLDQDTTGLMVVAKTENARLKLTEQFASRTVKRCYKALALVTPRGRRMIQTQTEGRIESLLGRDPKHRKQMAVVESAGRFAATNWSVLEKFEYAYLLKVKLDTGRTHQIRVHMKHTGCPIIGDQVYGDLAPLPKKLQLAAKQFGRQALHAYSLGFIHPGSGKLLSFEVDLPDDYRDLLLFFSKGRTNLETLCS